MAGANLKVLSSEEKIAACRHVANQIVVPSLRSSVDFPRYLAYAIAALLRSHGDEDLSVWTVAEESLNLVVKVQKSFVVTVVCGCVLRAV